MKGLRHMTEPSEKTILVTTFSNLLEVSLSEEFRLKNVKVIDAGRGVYFGMTKYFGGYFVVARGACGNDEESDVNGILTLDGDRRIVGEWCSRWFDDLHQIRWHEDLLFVVNGACPELVLVRPPDPTTDESEPTLVHQYALSKIVPKDLRHSAPAQHPYDQYHFNSVHVSGDEVWILAHNWGFGAFAVRFGLTDLLNGHLELKECRQNLGIQSHDVFDIRQNRSATPDALDVLSSGENCMVRSDAYGSSPRKVVDLDFNGGGFPRGLAVGQSEYIVGLGVQSDTREERKTGRSEIRVIDRPSLQTLTSINLGNFGNICDVLFVSETDFSDVGVAPKMLQA